MFSLSKLDLEREKYVTYRQLRTWLLERHTVGELLDHPKLAELLGEHLAFYDREIQRALKQI